MITNLDQYLKTENEDEIIIKYTEKEYITDIEGLKHFYLLKMENENEITLNAFNEAGKLYHHETYENNPIITELFKMNPEEIKVSGTEMNAQIIKCTGIETGIL